VVETETAGMLPEAEVAFLDEVFLGSTAILNTLLALLNERTFRRGRTAIDVPLRVCVGASNQLPDDDVLAAFADRFLSRVFVDPVPDHALEAMLAKSLGRPKSDLSVERGHTARIKIVAAAGVSLEEAMSKLLGDRP
jgi:MoxR-like ATPase